MMRDSGAIQTLKRVIPPELIPVFVLITYLGSLWVILPGLAILYRWWDANRTAFVGSAALGGYALTLTLKNLFRLPRPPVSFQLIHATGYGFPSGHALDATVTYGALVVVVHAGTRRQRTLVASVLVGLVAFSRVVLGVHYVVDVVAGIALGLAYLGVLIRVFERNVSDSLTVATLLAVIGVIVTGGGVKSVILLGGLLVTVFGWRKQGHDHV